MTVTLKLYYVVADYYLTPMRAADIITKVVRELMRWCVCVCVLCVRDQPSEMWVEACFIVGNWLSRFMDMKRARARKEELLSIYSSLYIERRDFRR